MKKEYIVYGSVDDGSNNMTIYYGSDDIKDVTEVYEKLLKLSKMTHPNDKDGHEDFKLLQQELQDEGIDIWNTDICNPEKLDFTVCMAEVKRLK